MGAISMILTCALATWGVIACLFIDRDMRRAKEKQEKGDGK